MFLGLSRPAKRLGDGTLQLEVSAPSEPKVKPAGAFAYLGEINAEGIHVEAVHEAGKALAEAGQALVHELEVHHVGLEVGDGIGELGEGGLEGIEREGLASPAGALG